MTAARAQRHCHLIEFGAIILALGAPRTPRRTCGLLPRTPLPARRTRLRPRRYSPSSEEFTATGAEIGVILLLLCSARSAAPPNSSPPSRPSTPPAPSTSSSTPCPARPPHSSSAGDRSRPSPWRESPGSHRRRTPHRPARHRLRPDPRHRRPAGRPLERTPRPPPHTTPRPWHPPPAPRQNASTPHTRTGCGPHEHNNALPSPSPLDRSLPEASWAKPTSRAGSRRRAPSRPGRARGTAHHRLRAQGPSTTPPDGRRMSASCEWVTRMSETSCRGPVVAGGKRSATRPLRLWPAQL